MGAIKDKTTGIADTEDRPTTSAADTESDAPRVTVADVTDFPNKDDNEADRREARDAIVEKIIINYPRYNAILAEADYMFQMVLHSREPLGMLLAGLMGAGKTTLTDAILAKYPPYRMGGVMKHPVVRATVPSRATDHSVASAFLRAFGDPRWSKGTLTNMTFRLIECFKRAETRLIIVDEVQHFMDQNSNRIVIDAANWLKTLIKDEDIHIGCILVGLHDEAKLLLAANGGQLGSFFGKVRMLGPLAWDENSDDPSKNEFYRFLIEVDHLLPFDKETALVDPDIAWRCHIASRGILRPTMRLVRRAAHTAIDAGKKTIDRELLAEAFDLMDPGDRPDIPNPFDADLQDIKDSIAGTAMSPVPSSGTNNRGGKRRGRPPKEDNKMVKAIL